MVEEFGSVRECAPLVNPSLQPDSCHRGTSVDSNAERIKDRLSGVGEWVSGVVLVAGDRDGDVLQRP